MAKLQQEIKDIALIGNRRTCALVSKDGNICWYSPRRFDKPAILASLLDLENGGYFKFGDEKVAFKDRSYEGDSAILTSTYQGPGGLITLTDWMPMDSQISGICRLISRAPFEIEMQIQLKDNYGLQFFDIQASEKQATYHGDQKIFLTCSHKIVIDGDHITWRIPADEVGWAVIADDQIGNIDYTLLMSSLESTRKEWRKVQDRITYNGPYEEIVRSSLRAIRLLTYSENGGIIAAATTSLPEILGGDRNYDYRYVWLRDSAMIVSALTRAGSDGVEERKFLTFLCDAKQINNQKNLVPFYALDKTIAKKETHLNLSGYRNSQPVRIGNNAKDQLQLDANANVLLAAKLIYNRFEEQDHWETVRDIAEFLVENWEKPDHGIWEEDIKQQFTSSKVISAIGLQYIADHADTEEQAKRWLKASKDIKNFVQQNCLTKEGAYAVYPGSEHVDITAALFPVWGFTDVDSKEMLQTVALLDRDYKDGDLYRRRLELTDSSEEGVFLAASLWMAQYFILKGDLKRCERIFEAVNRFSTDLGFLPEEGDMKTSELLGNIPQTFVHASFVGAIIDYKEAIEKVRE